LRLDEVPDPSVVPILKRFCRREPRSAEPRRRIVIAVVEVGPIAVIIDLVPRDVEKHRVVLVPI